MVSWYQPSHCFKKIYICVLRPQRHCVKLLLPSPHIISVVYLPIISITTPSLELVFHEINHATTRSLGALS